MPNTWAAGDELTAQRLNDSQEIYKLLTSITADGAITTAKGVVLDTSNSKGQHPVFVKFGDMLNKALSNSGQIYNQAGSRIKMWEVTSTRVVAFYFDGGGNGVRCSQIDHDGAYNVSTITTNTVSTTAGIDCFQVAQLSTTSAIVHYQEITGSDSWCKVVTSLDGTYTTGTETGVSTTNLSDEGSEILAISATEAVAIYSNVLSGVTGTLYYRSITISGTTPTVGAEQTLKSTRALLKGATMVGSSMYAIICYYDGTNVVGGVALYDTGTHTFGTMGSTQTIATGGSTSATPTDLFDFVSVSTTKVIMANCHTAGTTAYVRAMSISGTTLTVGTAQALTGTLATTNIISVCDMGGGYYAVAYGHDTGSVNSFRIQAFTESSNTITLVGSYYNHGINNYRCPGICMTTSGRLMTYYSDQGGGTLNWAQLLELRPESSPVLGVANETVADAASFDCVTEGIVTGLSGLTVGTMYYIGHNGLITKNPTCLLLGQAISSTSLFIHKKPEQFEIPKFRRSTNFEVAAHFSTIAVVGTGAWSIGTSYGQLLTGATSGSSANVGWLGVSGSSAPQRNLLSGYPRFGAAFHFSTISAVTSTGGGLVVGVGRVTVAGTGFTLTPAHFGFKVISNGTNLILYGTQADGTTEAATAALCTIGTAVDQALEVHAVHKGSSIDYYWRYQGGSLCGPVNVATNLPDAYSNQANDIQFAISNASTTNQYTVQISDCYYER